MLSRITGMGRDMLMAYCFGTEPAIAAFFVAFRLSNLFRRIFGEGALTVSFIPHFEELHRQAPARAACFFRDLVMSLFLVLFLIIGLSEVGLLSLAKWGNLDVDNQQIVVLIAVMMPGLLFICLSALFASLLQCERIFFLPGVSPIAFNCIWMGATWALRNEPPATAVMGLATAVTVAFVVQWLVLVPRTAIILQRSLPLREWLRAQVFSPDLRILATSLSLGVIGVCAMQINSAVDALFARYSSLEGPAYLNFAIRLQQLPLALFAIAISSAALPALSRAMAKRDLSQFRELLQFALARTFMLVCPCTLGIIALGGAAINLIFGRGQFQNESVVHTTTCLFGYGLGLLPASLVVLFASAFYSRKEYWTPTLASLIAIATNVLLNSLLIFGLGWGAESVAIATSLAAFVNFWWLSRCLSGELGSLFTSGLLTLCGKVLFCSIVACAVSLGVGALWLQDPTLYILGLTGTEVLFPRALSQQIWNFVILSGSFGCSFLLVAFWSNTKEFLGLIRWRVK